MNRLSLFLCLFILSIPHFALSADEPSVTPAEPVKASEPPVPTVTTNAESGEVKVGSVDLPLVVEKSEAGTKAMSELKALYEKFQKTMKKKEKELEKLKTALQGGNLTPENRAAKEKQFQKKFGEYQKYGSEAQKEFAEKQAELGKKIKEEMDRIVRDYGREHGYSVIINREGLVYSDSRFEVRDLTDEILKVVAGGKEK